MPKPDRVKVIARAGVVAEQVIAKGRTSEDLRKRIRDMVERAIVGLDMIATKEHLQVDDIDKLGKLSRLLTELDRKIPIDPGNMTQQELEEAAKDT